MCKQHKVVSEASQAAVNNNKLVTMLPNEAQSMGHKLAKLHHSKQAK